MNEVELTKLDSAMFGAYMEHNIDLILSHCADDVLVEDYGAEPARGNEAVRGT